MDDGADGWTSDELEHLADTHELEITATRVEGRPARWVPIWVVVEGDRVFVRTWHRRTTGWYGHAVASGRAWIRVAGDPVEVVVTANGAAEAAAVDAAYRAKYGGGAASMVTVEAAASTLRLVRAQASSS